MTRSIDFLPEAEAEVEVACDWYEDQRPGLGVQFLLEFDAVLLRVSEDPRVFPRVARRTHKVLLRRFPYVVLYVVLYVVHEDLILITGVFHGHRDPGVWSDRVRERSAAYRTTHQPTGAA